MTQDEALKFIDEKVKGNDVVLFMKGTADFPMCGFSGRVVQMGGCDITTQMAQSGDLQKLLAEKGIVKTV
jgi:glutaredoxin-related protein